MIDSQRKVVLGLGNLLNRDEGLGIRALESLSQTLGERQGIEFVDGAVLGLNLLPLVEECSHLLVLDAINSGQPGGSFIEMSRHEIPLYSGIKLSEHQLGFQEVLGLALLRGLLPDHLHLVGIQPVDMELGIGLSQPVESTLPQVVERAVAILKEWRLIDGY
jgi:hydrogenase maturation protease